MAPLPPPRLDSRSYGDLVAQLEELAGTYSGWRPAPNGQDAGSALIRIFARMMSHTLERLNQVPEKHHLAFLDLLGAQRLPPRPARAALTFSLAEKASEGLVPAGTQVGAGAVPEGSEEIVFETERSLVLTRARLTSLFVRDRRLEGEATSKRSFQVDRVSDHSPLSGAEPQDFQAFKGYGLAEHSIFLSCDSLFTLPGIQKRWLDLRWKEKPTVEMEWSFWDGARWQPLVPQKSGTTWSLNLDSAPAIRELNGRSARWLQGRLIRRPLAENKEPEDLPRLVGVEAGIEVKREGLAPDVALFNSVALDLSKDFYPLGERPRFNDTFAVASGEAFSQPGREVTLTVTLTRPPPHENSNARVNPRLSWELWDGSTWLKLGESTTSGSTPARKERPFTDQSRAFTEAGSVELTLPEQLGETEVGGRRNRWLRVRLVEGGYGEDMRIDATDGKPPTVKPATYMPPSIQSLKLSYSSTLTSIPEACLLLNDGAYEDCTARLAAPGDGVEPFVLSEDPGPSLYLGFDRPFPNRPILLHVELSPPHPDEVLAPSRTPGEEPSGADEPLQLAWEYRSTRGWVPLRAEDETQSLGRSGALRFIGPADFAPGLEFGQERYWLRVRWRKGGVREHVRLRRVLTNTVWASHATTATCEVLGSSNGEPEQRFTATRTPVLPGPRLEVREPALPEPQEQAELEALEGPDAITLVPDERGGPPEVWVRWHAVPDLRGSGPRERHYVIDHQTGEVRFGNGRQGRIPPVGRDGIRLAWYRSGGGARGNVSAGLLTRLKAPVPYVDKVLNPAPASGGADLEELGRLKERGSRALRHRGLAVTVEDFADLAREASPDVARVLVIPPLVPARRSAHPRQEQGGARGTGAARGRPLQHRAPARARPRAAGPGGGLRPGAVPPRGPAPGDGPGVGPGPGRRLRHSRFTRGRRARAGPRPAGARALPPPAVRGGSGRGLGLRPQAPPLGAVRAAHGAGGRGPRHHPERERGVPGEGPPAGRTHLLADGGPLRDPREPGGLNSAQAAAAR
ncbi:hypothetical protein Q664_00185 [Archangium violaceum Cb vi76]|uniref:Uncharacterized protein n=1 Tax=Archangium violaceum Cb vi76 TaxID=1406225 RepID=A0A084T290_9BACT|nr:baseplate J/gp47 family protein [Archangium violaceum]KFA94825.1 hypothetical protein Q664_00185 [Archangium violaceum Cb vi76]